MFSRINKRWAEHLGVLFGVPKHYAFPVLTIQLRQVGVLQGTKSSNPRNHFIFLDMSRLRSKLRCISSRETYLPAIPGRPFDILVGSRERCSRNFLPAKFVASKCLCCALTTYEIWATDYWFLS
jgi:hypothetical protein